ncbi:hypothetical protein ACGF3G_27865 [Streptomyces sp. NPDC048179]|uniref:hypothetical protein n=1 Tax=Streptomyces sp. NPDC048179 TaxID=3365506 RepID=UPI003712EAA1
MTTVLFAVSAAVAVAGQLKITAWARARWSSQRAIVYGITLMSTAFLPPFVDTGTATGTSGRAAWAVALAPLFAPVVLPGLGTAMVYPFEMDTVVSLAGGRLVAPHHGLCNTVAGLGITPGNLTTGAVRDAADRPGRPNRPGGCSRRRARSAPAAPHCWRARVVWPRVPDGSSRR